MKQSISQRLAQSRFGVMLGALVTLFVLTTFSVSAQAEQINLNQADAETLEYIPGIGPAKARDIVTLRESSNGFSDMQELLEVKGIGEKTLQNIRMHGALDQGVSSLTEEMRNNPAKRMTDAATATDNTSG